MFRDLWSKKHITFLWRGFHTFYQTLPPKMAQRFFLNKLQEAFPGKGVKQTTNEIASVDIYQWEAKFDRKCGSPSFLSLHFLSLQ